MLEFHNLPVTYSPVPKLEIVRTFLSMVNTCCLVMKQLDFVTAFLNGELSKTVFVEIPEGFGGLRDRGRIWKLKKAL